MNERLNIICRPTGRPTCSLFSRSIWPPIAPYGYRYGEAQSRIRNCNVYTSKKNYIHTR